VAGGGANADAELTERASSTELSLAPVPEVALRGFFDELRQQGLIEGQNLTDRFRGPAATLLG
jgi:hypothetical protein